MSIVVLVLIGLAAGVSSGLFGIGGGLIMVPALVFFLGFTQHKATGTSLAVLLPPIGLAAVIEFYRHGHVDLRAALVIAAGLFLGAWLGARFASKLTGPHLRLLFGVFTVLVGGYLIRDAVVRLTKH